MVVFHHTTPVRPPSKGLQFQRSASPSPPPPLLLRGRYEPAFELVAGGRGYVFTLLQRVRIQKVGNYLR